MGSTMSFNNVIQFVKTGGGLLLDESAFGNNAHSYAQPHL
jgi:hypothetical protein